MPVIEMDETQYAAYQALMQNARPVVGAVEQIMANPKARKKFLEARKIADPNASIPEIDAAAPVEEAVSEVRTEFATLRKELADERAARTQAENLAALNSRWEKGRDMLRAQGYTEEGIIAIEKVMEAEGIANHAAGAAYHDRLNPPAEPVQPESKRFDIFAAPGKDDVMKLLHEGDDEGFLNSTIAAIRGETKQAGRR